MDVKFRFPAASLGSTASGKGMDCKRWPSFEKWYIPGAYSSLSQKLDMNYYNILIMSIRE